MKKIIYPTFVSFITFYMLFIYEPIIMFIKNKNEFWFDIYTILPSLIIIVLVLTLIFSLIYIIINKYSNKILNIVTIINVSLLIILYIHGNFMASNLNILDGSKYVLKNHHSDIIASIIVIGVISLIIIFSSLKYSTSKTIKATRFITILIFLMITSGLLYSLSTNKKALVKKDYMILTTDKNMYTYSKKTNFIIFLADGADSVQFDKARKDSKYKNIFKDFTYYPDTMSTYGNTSNSIPFIMSGIWDEKEEAYNNYSKKAYRESKFLKTLEKQKYDINLYIPELIIDYDDAQRISNLSYKKRSVNTYLFFKQELKYISFKYLPYFLKQYSDIDNFKLSADNLGAMHNSTEKYLEYTWDNFFNYTNFINIPPSKKEANDFKFIHVEGPHLPFNTDENFNIIENGTYEQKLKATLKLFDAYLKMLKDNDLYDNSIIIFLADHGFSEKEDYIGRQNPILYIKGLNEHHAFKTSDKPISFTDLMDTYNELLEGKKSTELFKNIKNNRKRRFLYYPNQYGNELVEFYQTGKAWDWSTMKETGKVYRLKGEENAN